MTEANYQGEIPKLLTTSDAIKPSVESKGADLYFSVFSEDDGADAICELFWWKR